MASVQELLQAAQAKKSPFISLLEGAAQGIGTAQNNALERTKTLMALDQSRQEMEYQQQARQQLAQTISAQTEARILDAKNKVGIKPAATFPTQKLEETVSVDSKGYISKNYKVIEPKENQYQFKEYADAQGRARIGRANTATGKIETLPDDPFAPVARNSETDPVKRAKDLRNEFTDLSKDFFKVNESVARVRAASSDPSAAGDLALIFNYMKILDPGSVVRESEFATAQNSAGVPDRIRAQYNKLLSGERLAPETRNDFVDRAERLFEEQRAVHSRRTKEYERLAQLIGADPRQVIVDPVIDKAEKKTINKSGEDQFTESNSTIPKPGEMFMGKKVLSVKRVK